MKKNFKKIAILIILATRQTITITMHRTHQEAPKLQTHRQNTNPNHNSLGKNGGWIDKSVVTEQNQNKSTNNLTEMQKLAIQARNVLASTKIPNQKIIDTIAGTQEFKTSDGTKYPQKDQSRYYGESGIELEPLNQSSISAIPYENRSQRNTRYNQPREEYGPKEYVENINNEIIQFDRNKLQSKRTPIDKNGIDISRVTLKSIEVLRPQEIKILDTKNNNNPRDTQYRNFLNKISYEDIRTNIKEPKTHGYTSRIDATRDYVNKLLIDMGTPDSFFLSSRYASKRFKEIVKSFSDAINFTAQFKNQETQYSPEIKAQQELVEFVKAEPVGQPINLLGENLIIPSTIENNMQVAVIPGESVRDLSHPSSSRTGVIREYNTPYQRLTDINQDFKEYSGPKLIGPERKISTEQTKFSPTEYNPKEAAQRFEAFDTLVNSTSSYQPQ